MLMYCQNNHKLKWKVYVGVESYNIWLKLEKRLVISDTVFNLSVWQIKFWLSDFTGVDIMPQTGIFQWIFEVYLTWMLQDLWSPHGISLHLYWYENQGGVNARRYEVTDHITNNKLEMELLEVSIWCQKWNEIELIKADTLGDRFQTRSDIDGIMPW